MKTAEHKGALQPQKFNAALRRQTFGLGLGKFRHQGDFALVTMGYLKDADAPCLNQPSQLLRRAGQKHIRVRPELRSVVCDQFGPQSHQLQRQSRFSGAGGPQNQQTLSVDRNTTGMYHATLWCHTGRPTTNLAPKGSDVMSAWVGLMFSAQITPPCASMICLEIASPRPEWLPKSFFGRSE